MPPYPIKAVANYLLDIAEKAARPLTPMKLQKLVYFAHGWHLALRGQPLVDDVAEAWQFGPVFPSLYHEFKAVGGGDIKTRATDAKFDFDPATGSLTMTTHAPPTLDDFPATEAREFAKRVIERVWAVYGHWTGVQLSQLTHEQDSPWYATRQSNPDRTGVDIPEEAIQEYFARKVG